MSSVCQVLPLARRAKGARVHRPNLRFWSSARRETAQWLDVKSPLYARCLLLGRNNRCIAHCVFQVCRFFLKIDTIIKYVRIRSSEKRFENRGPISKNHGQVTLWRAFTHAPKTSFHESTISATARSGLRRLIRHKRSNPSPKLIQDNKAIFVHSTLHFEGLKLRSPQTEIPNVNRP